MRKIITCLLPMLPALLCAQEKRQARTYRIDEVVVTARIKMEDIGVQKTVLDTFALRESVTNSLADVLSQNSSIFIKSYGRATLSTASFRGTAPSHTQVLWNGLKVNSPMLGMVDFSMIPSYFIDDANLYHGGSSTGITGGGLGGAITLGTKPAGGDGAGLRYIQGVSSFGTYDQFLRITYGNPRWQTSTRLYYVFSQNDFTYTNYRKKLYEKDEQGRIAGYSYPVERNRNGSYKDFHLLQEAYYEGRRGSRWGVSAWYLNSRRGVPMLNVDYKSESQTRNRQDEQTFRGVVGWNKSVRRTGLSGKAGYTYTDLQYIYLGDVGTGSLVEMIHSRSYVNTAYARFDAEYCRSKWMATANVAANQHFVRSMDRAVITSAGERAVIGYDKARLELSAFASARYTPVERLGLAVNLRAETYGDNATPLIPGAFADYLVSRRGSVKLKASISRNYRYPTLNDLYFMPGGNDTLKTEKGYTYDGGVEFAIKGRRSDLKAEVAAYNSDIRDWIVWLPTFKGFWSPVNVKRVHSYGLEVKAGLWWGFAAGWFLAADANFARTRSINHGDPVNWADESIGKQLVYIPEYSASATGKLTWRSWRLTWKWNYYSERFTTSSNERATKIGLLGAYYMNDASLEKRFSFKWAGISLKAAVNNIFDEEYESVLSRPMAGRNYGFFIEIIPAMGKARTKDGHTR